MPDRQDIPVTVEGGFRSGDEFSVRIHDAANGSLMLELVLAERTIFDLLRNRSRGNEATGTLSVVGKGLAAHGLVREHGQLVIELADFGAAALNAAIAKIDEQLGSDEGWSFDRNWNMHRVERQPGGTLHYRLWARRLVRPAVIDRWPAYTLGDFPGVVRWEPGSVVQ